MRSQSQCCLVKKTKSHIVIFTFTLFFLLFFLRLCWSSSHSVHWCCSSCSSHKFGGILQQKSFTLYYIWFTSWDSWVSSEILNGCQNCTVKFIWHKNKIHYHVLGAQQSPWEAPLPKIQLTTILPSMRGSSKWFLPSGFLTKTLYNPLLPPYMLHAPPTSFFSVWSPTWNLLRSTHH